MDPKIAEAIGLLRHQIISPVLMDTRAAQMAYFRQTSVREFDVPGAGQKRFSATTMKAWLYRYRKRGFAGITPKPRCDIGKFRNLTEPLKAEIKNLRGEHLTLSCVKFYDRCLKENKLGTQPICMETLRRFLRSENLYQTKVAQVRKKFEMSYFGELWTCDFMHGPGVSDGASKRKKKAILLAIIDDHSRMIVGARFDFFENTKLLESVFKDAILMHGMPDRLYCDNGPSFSSTYLSKVCAHLNVGLVHSKPYDSPSRGKIERFFRTVRENFLVEVSDEANFDLKMLNDAFGTWLRGYHHGQHRGINTRPIDKYQLSIKDYPRKRVAEETLDEFFLVVVQRVVNKDCTVSLHGIYYELPPEYIGKKVELKYKQEHPSEVYLYDKNIRVTRVAAVDSILNGKSHYVPGSRISDVALHGVSQGFGGTS